MVILSTILGILVGSVSMFFISKKHINKKYISIETIKDKYKSFNEKRGVFKQDFTWKGDDGDTTVEVTIEFSIIEETENMFKINFLNCYLNNLSYFDEHHINSYKKAFDKRWYYFESNEIEWIKESKLNKRKRILKSILNENNK